MLRKLLKKYLNKKTINLLKIVSKYVKKFGKLSVLIVYSPFIVVVYLLGIRFVKINVSRIGHLIADTTTFLEYIDYFSPVPKIKLIVLNSNQIYANSTLQKYIARNSIFISNPATVKLLVPLTWCSLSGFYGYKSTETNYACARFKVKSEKGNIPRYKLDPEDRFRCEEKLIEEGLELDQYSFVVCLHIRTSEYSLTRSHTDFGQEYRNSNFCKLSKSIKLIDELGGISIRVGDLKKNESYTMPGLFNYCSSKLKSDLMDLYLLERCDFLLGSLTGLVDVANEFGTPCALFNVAPFSHARAGFLPNLILPCVYKHQGKKVKFEDILKSELSNLRFSKNFSDNEIELLHSSDNDIRDLTIEMIEQLGLKKFKKKHSAIQKKLIDTELKNWNSFHYSFYGSGKIAKFFKMKNYFLFS